jgi:hypothetical protein
MGEGRRHICILGGGGRGWDMQQASGSPEGTGRYGGLGRGSFHRLPSFPVSFRETPPMHTGTPSSPELQISAGAGLASRQRMQANTKHRNIHPEQQHIFEHNTQVITPQHIYTTTNHTTDNTEFTTDKHNATFTFAELCYTQSYKSLRYPPIRSTQTRGVEHRWRTDYFKNPQASLRLEVNARFQ